MQLVQSRPIPLPCFRDGGWYDDFAVTGANNPSYNLVSGTKDMLSYGIKLKATTGTTSTLILPVNYSNFKAESIIRRVAGALTSFMFRYVNSNNRWLVRLTATALDLQKQVSGEYTILGKINTTTTNFNRVGVEALGPNISVFLDGVKVISVIDWDNMSGGNLRFEVYDSTVGVAQGEYQYIAIRPL